jgi:TPR repeat protein
MEQFSFWDLEKAFTRFERAAAKGHEESIWITSVLKGVEMKKIALKEAFAKTEEPLGWYFAGKFVKGRKRFDFYKKSAEGGCSWGQIEYAWYFKHGDIVEKDKKVYVEWLENAVAQNNPQAMELLGDLCGLERDDKEKAVSLFRAGAQLGWKGSMRGLADMLRKGEGCAKDLRRAAMWSAKGELNLFWDLLADAKRALQSGKTEDLDCGFNQLCYSLGWGMYWYQCEIWNKQTDENKAFGSRCLDFYCSCIELQQESIFMFLLCWNRTTGVKKGPGQSIAKRVWEGRGDILVKSLEQDDGEEPEAKQIKK